MENTYAVDKQFRALKTLASPYYYEHIDTSQNWLSGKVYSITDKYPVTKDNHVWLTNEHGGCTQVSIGFIEANFEAFSHVPEIQFEWKGAEDDLTSRFEDWCLRVEKMNENYWWYCVTRGGEDIWDSSLDERVPRTLEEAKQAAEKVIKQYNNA